MQLLRDACGVSSAARLPSGGEAELRPGDDQAAERRARGARRLPHDADRRLRGRGPRACGAIDRLLDERPAIKGISVPGMPAGSPGMFGEKEGPLTVYEIAEGATAAAAPKVFVVE